MKLIYRVDINGKSQLQKDETGMGLAMKRAAKRLGYVVTELLIEVEGELIEIMALTPDTMLAAERLRMQKTIEIHYPRLMQIKRIVFS